MRFLFLGMFLFLYLLAIIILKPLRIHSSRKFSTVALKFSYLVYLAIFLIYSYFYLFFDIGSSIEDPDNALASIQFGLLLASFVIPNTGILIRRKISSWRTQFNIIMSFVNAIFAIYLWILIERSFK
jgi:hypothetical protein